MICNKLKSIAMALLFVCACAQAEGSTPLQQTIYFGGDIITMEGDEPGYVEAVMVRDGNIIYAGDKAGAVNNFAGQTIEVDLRGKTLLPGFIDPHGHSRISKWKMESRIWN